MTGRMLFIYKVLLWGKCWAVMTRVPNPRQSHCSSSPAVITIISTWLENWTTGEGQTARSYAQTVMGTRRCSTGESEFASESLRTMTENPMCVCSKLTEFLQVDNIVWV